MLSTILSIPTICLLGKKGSSLCFRLVGPFFLWTSTLPTILPSDVSELTLLSSEPYPNRSRPGKEGPFSPRPSPSSHVGGVPSFWHWPSSNRSRRHQFSSPCPTPPSTAGLVTLKIEGTFFQTQTRLSLGDFPNSYRHYSRICGDGVITRDTQYYVVSLESPKGWRKSNRSRTELESKEG